VLVLSALVGCGAAAPVATSPQKPEPAVGEPAAMTQFVDGPESVAVAAAAPHGRVEEPVALEIPTECDTSGAKVCTPPTSFVAKLCQSKSADVALSMFRKSTPWTRAYVRRATDAWYMGARRTSPVRLVLDEEVIVVASRTGASSGIQVSGSGSYDVYRWDGQCVSVAADEVSLRRPPVPRSASIVWKSLTDATRGALLDDREIKSRHAHIERNHCEDSTTPRCIEETTALTRLIADYVRRGGKLPDARLSMR
jgi:hypothetical protein